MAITAQMIEFLKCMDDVPYSLKTYNETFDQTKNKFVPFALFTEQVNLIELYKNNRFVLVSKYRQAGITTVTAGYCANRIVVGDPESPEKILILANKQETAMEFLAKIKNFIDQYPIWIGVGKGDNKDLGALHYGKESQKHITILNRDDKLVGEVKSVATSLDALRGYTPTLLILDEAAFIEGGAELWSACLASLSTGGKAIMISTPRGMDELYYKTYTESMNGINTFKVFQMYWYDDPRYNKDLFFVQYEGDLVDWMSNSEVRDMFPVKLNGLDIPREEWQELFRDNWKPCSPWYESMCRELNFDKRMINQEINCNFLGSGDNVVEERIIVKQETENVCDPIEKQLEQKLWIWKQPEIGHKYIMGVDVSRGDSDDFSCFNIIDFDEMEQVAEYQTKLPPDIFAEIVFKWANTYTAFIVVDITGGMGVATSRKLQDLSYPNEMLYFDGIKDADRWKYGIYDDKTAGINYNNKRAQIIQSFEEGVRTNFKIRSKRLIQEMKTFVYLNGRADHTRGSHDDIIQSLAMTLYVAQNSFTRLKENEKKIKSMLNAWTSSTVKKDDVTKPKIQNNQPGNNYMWLFSGLQ